MGKSCWTDDLSNKLDSLREGRISLKVDGPYGQVRSLACAVSLTNIRKQLSLNIWDYPYVVLCAGGVGVTAMMSVLGDLYNHLWSKRLKHIKEIHFVCTYSMLFVAIADASLDFRVQRV